MNNSKHSQRRTSGSLDEALAKARKCVETITTKPYYNEQGFVKYPPMDTQGQEINNPRHNPLDLPSEQECAMDNDDYKL